MPSGLKTPPRPTQRTAVERLWRRAEEIRSLCGLPPLTGHEPGAPESGDPAALEPLVEILLRDLETNFRRELATRVQLEGLGELLTEPRALREGYLEQLNQFTDQMKKLCRGMHVDFQRMNSGEPLDVALSSFLATRSASIK